MGRGRRGWFKSVSLTVGTFCSANVPCGVHETKNASKSMKTSSPLRTFLFVKCFIFRGSIKSSRLSQSGPRILKRNITFYCVSADPKGLLVISPLQR